VPITQLVAEAACAVLSISALCFDLLRGRIPDYLTFPAMLLGLAVGAADQGWAGFLGSGLGLAMGLGLLIPLHFIRGPGGKPLVGGGDVKLMAAVGALGGWLFLLSAALLGGLIGVTVALAFLAAGRRRFRYGAALAAGTLLALLLRHTTSLIP